jgi:hypothetical protein
MKGFLVFLIGGLFQISSLWAQCPLPAKPECVIQNSQYTILGTVTDNNIGKTPYASTRNYNASIAVQCVWASFTNPPASGFGLVDTIIPVMGYGRPYAGCPNADGSDAEVNSTQIFFIYLHTGALSGPSLYAVSNPCAGSLPYSPENVQLVANLVGADPSGKIAAQYRGTKPECTLPAPQPLSTGSSVAGSNKPKAVVNIPNPGAASGGLHYKWPTLGGLFLGLSGFLILLL